MKKEAKKENCKALSPVSQSPHTAPFLAYSARFDIEGHSASKEPHGLPKGITT